MARKCNFDRQEKLQLAMELFWSKGYANTSVADLVEKLNINRFSLYNSFTDKQSLYYEALDHYLQTVSLPGLVQLSDQSASLPDIIRFLTEFAARQHQSSCGCFMQNALVEHAGQDESVLQKGDRLFDTLQELLLNALQKGQQCGEITSLIPAEQLSALIISQMQGFRVLSKAHRENEISAALDALVKILQTN
ncbi:TetR/AcrR family transcriptional regulator [Vibrio sp.]|uniref:TetR/AcrR family transcriptional regulator n=1 Tax=Vibrio sp. TaxID=678 RepID=UPI003D114A44